MYGCMISLILFFFLRSLHCLSKMSLAAESPSSCSSGSSDEFATFLENEIEAEIEEEIEEDIELAEHRYYFLQILKFCSYPVKA